MAVKELSIGKISFSTDSRIKPKSIKKGVPIITNKIERDGSIYGEPLPSNGNLQVEELMNTLIGKINNIGDISNNDQNGIDVVDIDINREIYIDGVDKNAIKSEVIEGKVLTKTEKLRSLRRHQNNNGR